VDRCGGSAIIVDSDDVSRDLVQALLSRAGFNVLPAGSGSDAIDFSRALRPWLVLSEVQLPDISGYELCRQLRDEFGDEIAFVFMSGDRTEPRDRAAGLLVGGDDYIVKPFDPSELLARVRRLAQRTGQNAHLNGRPTSTDPPGQPSDVPARATATLSAREREVLVLLAGGHKPREIADQLEIREKTVARHLERVLEKLSVHSRTHAVIVAYQEGLINPGPAGLTSAPTI
jgi:DNA-binding NarL/FixJ family response regulator